MGQQRGEEQQHLQETKDVLRLGMAKLHFLIKFVTIGEHGMYSRLCKQAKCEQLRSLEFLRNVE